MSSASGLIVDSSQRWCSTAGNAKRGWNLMFLYTFMLRKTWMSKSIAIIDVSLPTERPLAVALKMRVRILKYITIAVKSMQFFFIK